MSEEFHYSATEWTWLMLRLDEVWLPLDEFLSKHRPNEFSKEDWDRLDFDDDSSPNAIFVWRDCNNEVRVSTRQKGGRKCISAGELFLKRMRPLLQEAITLHEEGFYAPNGKIDSTLRRCNDKFSKLLKYVSKLPFYIRCELGTEQVASLEKILNGLIKPDRGPVYKLPRNMFRKEFQSKMLQEYRSIYGSYPNHTKKRRRPDIFKDNNTDFFSVATKMCEFAGFATTGIEEELAEIKASSPS